MSWLADLGGDSGRSQPVSLPVQRSQSEHAVLPAAHQVAAGIAAGAGAQGRAKVVPFATLAFDSAVISLAVFLAVISRNNIYVPGQVPFLDVSVDMTIIGPSISFTWLLVIALRGGYRHEVFGAGVDEYKRVLNASLLTAAVVGVGCYVTRYPLSRGFFVLTFAIGIPLLLTTRYLLRNVLQRARSKGRLGYRVIIVGTEGHVDEMASVLKRESWLGYNVIGAVLPRPGSQSETASGVALLGDAAATAHIAMVARADVVFLAGGAFDSAQQMRQVAWDLEGEQVRVVVAPSVTDVSNERVSFRPVGGLPLIHLDKPRGHRATRWAKRSFDLVGSAALIVAFIPVFAFAALRVWGHDRGPIIFRQPRVGRDGVEFSCLKFRTMVTNAEELLAELHQEQGYEGGLFKMAEDPRITKPGAWLRRFSIDELPQLFNVFRGDMSLVGPRPPLGHEVEQYDEFAQRRLRVRPGMTGLWQVSGRSELSWSEAIRLDLYYVDNWSMFQDIAILFRTFNAVFGKRGAY